MIHPDFSSNNFFQFFFLEMNWVEKCKKEMIDGTVNWKRSFEYQNVLTYDEDFCKDVIELQKNFLLTT